MSVTKEIWCPHLEVIDACRFFCSQNEIFTLPKVETVAVWSTPSPHRSEFILSCRFLLLIIVFIITSLLGCQSLPVGVTKSKVDYRTLAMLRPKKEIPFTVRIKVLSLLTLCVLLYSLPPLWGPISCHKKLDSSEGHVLVINASILVKGMVRQLEGSIWRYAGKWSIWARNRYNGVKSMALFFVASV
jgi:hypothetical protein